MVRAMLPTTRRGLLIGSAAAAATPLLPATASAAATSAPSADTTTAAPPPATASVSAAFHLLRRATFGPTPADLAEVTRLGAAGWLDRQLNPAAIPDAACEAMLTRLPLAQADIAAVRAAVEAKRAGKNDAQNQLGMAAIVRAAWSQRQLFEVMVDFWNNHLHITAPFGKAYDSRADYDRTVIRRHALGRFADMLKASARHPAMLSYLDNRHSTKNKPNENYARELLELHTVGTVHTEADVQASARLLTGLTVDSRGRYRYDAAAHATGAVRVLDFAHDNATAAGGEAAALAYVDYLATHPATAARIAHKLCVRFVADEPPAALVDRLARVYLDSGTAVAPVLRALFGSAEFAASTGQKLRNPYEDLIATVRLLGLGPDRGTGTTGLRNLYYMADNVGRAPFAWGPPNGFPDTAGAWASPSGLLGRWNNHMNLAAGWWPSQLTRPASLTAHLLPGVPATYGGLVDALTERLVGVRFAAPHRAALAAFFGKQPDSTLKSTDPAATSALPYLVALVLDSPYFAER